MKNLVVINTDKDHLSSENHLGTVPVFDRVMAFAKKLVPDESIVLLTETEVRAGSVRTLVRGPKTEGALLSALAEVSKGYENILYVYADCPFLDADLAEKMIENHRKYFAEYTFADGYPYGLSPEILSVKILPALQKLSDPERSLQRDTLFTLIGKDINSFDLETLLSPVDLRLLRASLCTDTKRNKLLCERIFAEEPKGEADILRILQEKPGILRTYPSYVNIQIVDGCPQLCSFCPYPHFGGNILEKRNEMSLENFSQIITKTASMCGDAVIGLSVWGEPSFHSRFPDICRIIEKYPGLSCVVETSGLGWTDEVLQEIHEILGSRISWIIDIDGFDEAEYTRLRGPGYSEAVGRAEFLIKLFPETAFIQSLRLRENEENLESFFRSWKEKTKNVVIQKYDWFSGFLPQKKVTDLSPLKRFPCWHIKRDLVVLLDGTVPLCREDLKKEFILGNILNESLETIWERGESYYLEHTQEKYSLLCDKCDEYYTYNF